MTVVEPAPPAPWWTEPTGYAFGRDDLHLEVEAAVGGHAAVYVGDEADVTALDPVATEGVRVLPMRVGLALRRDGPVTLGVEVAIEEGQAHAGGLEAAEARVLVSRGVVGGWIGRADLPVTWDRTFEAPELSLYLRPLLSRAALPLHANGAGAWVATGPFAAEAGASWASLTADAPWAWARLDLAPTFGRLTPRAGAGFAALPSVTLGTTLFASADVGIQGFGHHLLVGWMADRSLPAHAAAEGATADEPPADRSELWAELGVSFAVAPAARIFGAGRGERIVGLPDEEARWIVHGRVGAALLGERLELYVDGTRSVERLRVSEDVLVLDGGGLDRANDVVGFGVVARL